MWITLLILQCLIILLIFAVYDKVSQRSNEEVPNSEKLMFGQANTRDMEIFRQGLQQSWMHVNISLFKMWKDLDILDYESIQTKLQQTLEALTKNPTEMNEWAEKFKVYLKETDK